MKNLKIIAKIWILVLILTLAFFALIPKTSLEISHTDVILPEKQFSEIKKAEFVKNLKSEVQNTTVKNTINPTPEDSTQKFILKTPEKNLEIGFTEGESLYDAMWRAKNIGKLNFEGKNFPVLGYFVEEIEELKQGDDKFLFFYINGTESSVGVSAYKLKQGDQIEWRLK